MMTDDIRTTLHNTIDLLPDERLTDALNLLKILVNTGDADVEIEDVLLLASGALKRMNDEIDDAPPPVDDWRSYLRDL
ncbi:MAG TPA: hypothetical protein VHL11_09605 [Phototrophicaceae bacterium]|jgi:hypothetical protein|nr:hypothetical protein [Phototrophicaceae bacterium]